MESNNKFNVRLAWSFYDWANSAWSAIIITFIFSRYFVDVLAPNANIGTLYWTWTIGISSLAAALLSPIFGSLLDQSQRSKFWLIISTLFYCLISFSFWFAAPNSLNIFIIILLIFDTMQMLLITQVQLQKLLLKMNNKIKIWLDDFLDNYILKEEV